jgi:hypothetical protein
MAVTWLIVVTGEYGYGADWTQELPRWSATSLGRCRLAVGMASICASSVPPRIAAHAALLGGADKAPNLREVPRFVVLKRPAPHRKRPRPLAAVGGGAIRPCTFAREAGTRRGPPGFWLGLHPRQFRQLSTSLATFCTPSTRSAPQRLLYASSLCSP